MSEAQGQGKQSLVEMLKAMVQARASDIHLQAGAPPTVRIDGKLRPFGNRPLTPKEVEAIARALLTPEQLEELEYRKEMDFAYTIPGVARFRCNLLRQRGSFGLVMRVVSEVIPSFEALGLPREVMESLAAKERGLILVTGPTGSGKSTTLASMIDYINERKACHIVTIEDPIEFFHKHKRAIVNQREIGSDTKSFHKALRSVLRQAPDVILVGEMRDYETIAAAITAAETGHLVMGTLHTNSAPETIDRIVDVFPENQQEQVRVQLSNNLVAVLTQQLLPKAFGGGRVLAYELMIATPAVRALIREGKTHQLRSVIQTGGQYGMITMDACLADLYRRKLITYEMGLARAVDPKEFMRLAGAPEGARR